MNDITRSHRPAPTRRTLSARRRILPLLLTLAAAFAWGTPPAAAQYPTTHAPATPTPYSWPGFHAGGVQDGPAVPALSPTSTGYAGTLAPFVPDALFGMLQGTPSGLVTSGGNVYEAQIPSFLLGNYDPTLPPVTYNNNPADTTSLPAPNHFVDDSLNLPPTYNVFQAPFSDTNRVLLNRGQYTVTTDDQNATGFATTASSITPPSGGAAVPGPAWTTGLADGTATDGSAAQTGATYSRVPVAVDAAGVPLILNPRVPADRFATAVWTLTAPAAGLYKVSFTLPNPNTDNPPTEARIGDAHYVIRDNVGRVLANTRVSQTETNTPQFLAGSFPLASGEVITVTLDNSTRQAVSTANLGVTYVLADAMILGPVDGDVQGSPVAVNVSEYPEIANALYAGNSVTTTAGVTTVAPVIPSPTATELNGNLTPSLTPTLSTRTIRQMVYFTRNESVTRLDANGNLVAQPVGAIYGVDGNTNGVVWRYQTPGGSTVGPTGFVGTGLSGSGKQAAGAGPNPFQVGPVAYTTKGGATVSEGSAALATATLNRFGGYTAYDPAPILQLYNYPPRSYAAPQYTFALYTTAATTASATQIAYTGASIRIYAGGADDTKPVTDATSTSFFTADDDSILARGTFTNLTATATTTGTGDYILSGKITFDNTARQPGTGAGVWPNSVNMFGANGATGVTFTANLHIDTATGAVTLSNGVIGTAVAASPASRPIFTTPVVARVHVYAGPDAVGLPTYATRLVVIAADDAGYVYCLDALGNRDGTSNTLAVDTALNQPKYGLTAGVETLQVNQPNYVPHVGTTHAYWIYRPDLARAKVAPGVTGRGTVGTVIAPDSTSDLPTPGSFGLASPAIDIGTRLKASATSLPAATGAAFDSTNPLATSVPGTTADPGAPGGTLPYGASTADVYIGNSNGTLYKLNPLGVPLTTADIGPGLGSPVTTGDPFNASIGLAYPQTQAQITASTPTVQIPTPTMQWWLPVNAGSTGSFDGTDSITSAPALHLVDDASGVVHAPVTEVYFTTSNTSTLNPASNNSGRLYRVNGLGPVDNATAGAAAVLAGTTTPFTAAYSPGSLQYNTRAQARWSFPNAYTLINGSNKIGAATITVRPALGDIPGSPVLFRKPSDGANGAAHIYFAANVRRESQTTGTLSDDVPLLSGEAGRIWCVNTDGSFNFAYPTALDPTVAANDVDAKPFKPQPQQPIGGFQNATPAIGMVQFPAAIQFGPSASNFVHTDAVNTGGVQGKSVPMLYVGSSGANGNPRLYGLDLDGVNDVQRTLFADYATVSPTANIATPELAVANSGLVVDSGFASSPALVTNNSTAAAPPGNGGALYITETNGELYQFDATPQSSSNDVTAVTPDFGDIRLIAAGPYSSPAVAAFDTADLAGTTGTTKVVDWVYVGDSSTGLMTGLSPGGTSLNFGNGTGFGTNQGGYNNNGKNQSPGGVQLQQYPLYVYLFKDKANAQKPDMGATDAPIGGVIPAFEWGDNVYIRVANVVPPGDATTVAAQRITLPTTDYPSNSTYSSIFLTNGSPVSIQISETDRQGRIDVNRGADVGQVPAVLLNTPPGLNTNPPGNGFVRDDPADSEAGKFKLRDATGPFVGAYTYAIGDGSSRKNTPGSRRRIITATQTAQAYGVNAISGAPEFISTVTLSATVRTGGAGRTITSPTGVRTKVILSRVDQPTFAILNPLAVNGYGLPIASISSTGAAQPLGTSLGPFGKVPSTGTLSSIDLPAYGNGNRVYQNTTDLPKNGVLGNGNTPNVRTERVVSTTGLIGHGTSGGTVDPSAPTVAASPANPPDADGNGLLQIADRSDLGPTGRNLKLTMQPTAMQWNDNSHANGTGGATGDWVNGEGSRINRTPWEDVPTAGRAGQNHSIDYPDIAQTAVRHVLTSSTGKSTLTSSAATPDPAGGTVGAQTVNTDRLNIQIRVPKYQPANTQLYDDTNGPAAPQEGYDLSKTHNIYPMGYTAQMRIFVDSDHNHTYTSGEAYRDLTVYTGVPMDMGMTITSATTDLGALTQGFGVQTINYTPLGAFDPYSANYQSFFRPVTAFNNGNVNLLNAQFDQRVSNGGAVYGLPFSAGPLDANSVLSGYDMANVTGPLQSRFTLRSSLDNDLIGTGKDPRNPGLTGTATDPFNPTLTLNVLYPGVTFHKARPGDGNPSLLTVPDVPHDNNVPAFAVDTAPPNNLPNTGTGASGYRYSADPYIGMAVPIGTPVGTYSQNVRLFEGIDPSVAGGYTFDPLKGPKYGGVYGGRGAPNLTTPPASATDPPILSSALTIGNGQPYSTPTKVVAKVEEARITDSTTTTSQIAGTLPHGDTVALNKGDFSPAAYRDLFWTGTASNLKTPPTTPPAIGSGVGNINLYWTSSRDAVTTKPPYNIVGRSLPYKVGGGIGYFYSGVTATTGATSWYDTILPNPGPVTNGVLFPDTTGLNTGLTVAPEQHAFNGTNFTSSGNAYAFVQNTAAYGGATTGAPAYKSTIYCLQIDPATGQMTDTLPDLTAGPAPAFGTDARVVSSDPAQAKFGVKGLKVATGTAFVDPLSTTGATISRDLWAFWGSGARGRSSIAYTSTLTNGGSLTQSTWTPTASLPVPAGLSSTADPSPVITTAPDKNGNAVPAIDVTYTGIGPDGSTDLYVSRYRPYLVPNAPLNPTVGLALAPFAPVTEALQADPQVINWQARDVAWVRDTTTGPYGINVTVNGTSLALTGLTPQYDRASGTLVYTGVTAGPTLNYPNIGTTTVKGTVDTVYVDLVRGRVRFRVRQTVTSGLSTTTRTAYSLPATAVVTATFAPEARRITADTAADTEPVTFMDEAFKPNEANAALTSGTASLGRVQANRAWFIWRKAAFSKTAQPTLFYKTQRLTVALNDANGQPLAIKLDANGVPQVTVKLGGTTLYSPGNAAASNVADVDWARGRIYFPLSVGTKAIEGQPVTLSGSGINRAGATLPIDTSSTVQWLDEPRFNDVKFVPGDTSKSVPISAAVNEGTASAFLDPMAYADVQAGAYDPLGSDALTTHPDQPHKVWLYWSSTRNGTADIYSEAIEPRFSVRTGGGSVP